MTSKQMKPFWDSLISTSKYQIGCLKFFMFLNMVRKFQTVFCNFFSGHSTV